ncbi:hypothetical protein AVEN_163745-1 [Araneus ventricosus]|uniref:Uncharacterized protein n=1 Tax=Araneus ventricosus TaxID=182803 RepID=A0A4Y2MYR2_ARAVE|nr:hypothetical protein AVEN_163745-1 [Araneus ventricosus]
MLAKNVGMGRKHWTQLRRLLKERKKTYNWDLDGKDWFLFGESGANYVSSFLTLNCWLLFGIILADVVGWVVPYGRRRFIYNRENSSNPASHLKSDAPQRKRIRGLTPQFDQRSHSPSKRTSHIDTRRFKQNTKVAATLAVLCSMSILRTTIDWGCSGLVARPRPRDRRVVGSKPDSTEDPLCMGPAVR